MDELICVPLSCRLAAWLMASCAREAAGLSRACVSGKLACSQHTRSPEKGPGAHLSCLTLPRLDLRRAAGPAFVRRQLGP